MTRATIDRRSFLGGAVAVALGASGRRLWRAAPVAPPAEVLIIRHAEEPGGRNVHLSDRGRTRAAALPRLFDSRFTAPSVLFAARSSPESNRAVETLQPLAHLLHLKIDDSLADADYDQLAETVLTRRRYADAHILICWHHGALRKLATALGVRQPPAWPEPQYDHLWQLRFGVGGVTCIDQPQHLLPGDDAGSVGETSRRS